MMIRSRRTRPRSLPRSTDPTDAAALAARRAGRVLRGRDDPRRRAWHHPQRVGRTGLHLATVRIAGLASSGSEGASQSVRRGEGRASARADRRVAGRRARSRSRSTGLEHREGPDREHAAWDDLATASMSPALLYLFGRSAGRSSPRPCLPRRRRSPSRQRRLPMRRHAWVDGARPTRQHPQAGSIVRGRCAPGSAVSRPSSRRVG